MKALIITIALSLVCSFAGLAYANERVDELTQEFNQLSITEQELNQQLQELQIRKIKIIGIVEELQRGEVTTDSLLTEEK